VLLLRRHVAKRLKRFEQFRVGGVKLQAAKEFLRSEGARKRGIGPQGTTHEVRSGTGQRLTITWLDPDEPEPRLIEEQKAEQ
jgi:hypothetical protein